VDEDIVDRIRSATFALARKGYDKGEVDRFLDEVADWLETEGGGAADADVVRRELERIGEQTTAILTEAHDAAATMRTSAERQVRQQLADANLKAEALRSEADEYAEEIREDADAYVRRMRADVDGATERARIEAETALEEKRTDADAYAERVRREADERLAGAGSEAEQLLSEARERAERQAKQIVEDANRRRQDVEAVISDLEERRKAVVAELRRLASSVAGAAGDLGDEAETAKPVDRESDDKGKEESAEGSDDTVVEPAEPTTVMQTSGSERRPGFRPVE
jgi:DivIVA domain-containing protein